MGACSSTQATQGPATIAVQATSNRTEPSNSSPSQSGNNSINESFVTECDSYQLQLAVQHYRMLSAPVSRPDFERLRAEFWGTVGTGAYGGSVDMWRALHVSCESATQSEAAAIQASAGLTGFKHALEEDDNPAPSSSPPGHSYLAYCYDTKGFRYELPFYLFNRFRTPVLAPEHMPPPPIVHPIHPSISWQNEDQPSSGSLEPPDSKIIRYWVRFSDGHGDQSITQPASTPLSSIIQEVLNQNPQWKIEQLAFYLSGHRLKDQKVTLKQMGIKKDGILQCFVRSDNTLVADNKSSIDPSINQSHDQSNSHKNIATVSPTITAALN